MEGDSPAKRLRLLVTSLNRSVRALTKSMGRKGGSYVIAFTIIVTGGVRMYAVEERIFSNRCPRYPSFR